MQKVTRFGVSVPSKLIKEFDEIIDEEKYKNRSKAITELIRSKVSESEFTKGSHDLIGTITYLYDPTTRSVNGKIEMAVIESKANILSNATTPYRSKMMGVLACYGNWFDIKETYIKINSIKGMEYCKASFANPSIER
ncbi:MAG TPA: ribbon-helix-helix protein, CopG family [Candidatus Methanofastidiosa archaeon]|nr:ribbon-helix-helix protein, CopG family [Candidatus Methanofastidiosa archaeon]HPR41663.1 ribbon-helix-helix protein, CopG family [Candidatus Methanofastidiosa archaeon]